MTDDMYKVFKQRVFEASATTNKHLSVSFNKSKVPFKDFEGFCKMFLNDD
jgi:hypothetical protein